MTFANALEFMKLGKKVQRKSWLEYDYLFIENDILMCDGGFPFITLLKKEDINAKDWRIYDYK
jgi:hypothetical protein